MNILLVVAFALPSLLYLAAWWCARQRLASPAADGAGAMTRGHAAATPGGGVARPAIGGAHQRPVRVAGDGPGGALLLAALVLHALSISLALDGRTLVLTRGAVEASYLHFGFASALSVTLWLGVLILWLESLRMRIESLQVIVLPVAALAVLLPLFFPGNDLSRLAGLPLFVPHLLVGTLAYGLLLLAALHAGLMWVADRALHRPADGGDRHWSAWLDRLPPLLVLERILFRFLGVGFLMLTLTALSGILFSEQIFGQPLRFDHKTVFTLIAWGLFGLLLLGRRRWGWRGRTALRLTLSGFVVLLLAYVGSHFVREVLLQRY
ncbi:MAG: cytochrome c biogenesis protein CcsA [Burkholderiaceae bacterium]